jgi:hypothetical protein
MQKERLMLRMRYFFFSMTNALQQMRNETDLHKENYLFCFLLLRKTKQKTEKQGKFSFSLLENRNVGKKSKRFKSRTSYFKNDRPQQSRN